MSPDDTDVRASRSVGSKGGSRRNDKVPVIRRNFHIDKVDCCKCISLQTIINEDGSMSVYTCLFVLHAFGVDLEYIKAGV